MRNLFLGAALFYSLSALSIQQQPLTATALVFDELPLQSYHLDDAPFNQRRHVIQDELDVLFDQFLTPEGKDYFRETTPFGLGQVSIGFSNPVYADALKHGALSLEEIAEELPGMGRLVSRYEIEVESVVSGIVFARFLRNFNPLIVASTLESIDGVHWAQPGWRYNENARRVLRLSRRNPRDRSEEDVIYILRLQWGSCGVVCPFQRDFLFKRKNKSLARFGFVAVGEVGSPLPIEYLTFFKAKPDSPLTRR